ncbi:MAG: MATE family efflux transporter [Lachnospiraceae bacterium]|nr:MATE family efflux transporter [Lachnospiraceae bacterium]
MTTQSKADRYAFIKKLLWLAFPIVFQNLITTAVNSADVVMLGFISQDALSAGSLAGQIMYVLHLVFLGISSGIIILSAQYWGKRDMRTIENVIGIGMRFSIIISALFFVAACFFPELLMRIYTNDSALIAAGIPYLRVVSFSYLFMGISQVYLSAMRAVERIKFATLTNSFALVLNILLNAVFIFGLFGAPKLGIMGVALATSIARLIELLICLIDNMGERIIHFRIETLWHRNRLLFSDFIHFALPALANDVVWGLAFSTYSIIMGHLGSDVVAANAVAVVARNLGCTACFGIAHAGGILLGKTSGEGDLEKVKRDAATFWRVSLTSGILGGILLFFTRPIFHHMADLSATAHSYLDVMLLINTYYVLGKALNTAFIGGIFRSGGDTKFGFLCDGINMWCYAVPLGFIAAFLLKLPPMWVYFLISTDEFSKLPFIFRHYRSYKWLRNITREF